MSIEVKRKNNETVEAMLRRFNKKVLQSGVLNRAKQVRFYQKPKSKNQVRQQALQRLTLQQRREFLRKIGKLPDVETGSGQWSSLYRHRLRSSSRKGRTKVTLRR